MEDQQQLAACPFCGETPSIVTRNVEPQGDPWYGRKDETFVLCNCGACLFDGSFHEGFYDAETRAIAAWNRRASPSSSVLERARDALNDLMLVAQLVKFQADNSGRTPYTDWDSACSDLDRAQSKARSALAEIDRALGGGNG